MTRLFAAACFLVLASSAHATTVMVMMVDQGRAQLLINGSAIRELRAGQISPEGVRLVSADRSRAVLEVDGKELTLALGQSTVSIVELKANARGHFITTAHINGVATPAVIDTGATFVALSRDEAQRMSIDLAGAQRVQIATAGGPKYCYQVNLASVSVGAVALNNVAAVVMESSREELPITLIGMSFLNGVDMQRSGDTLTLSRRQF
jgi:aspartyl protease family protein